MLDRRRLLIAAAPVCHFFFAGPIRVFATNPDFAGVPPWTLVALASLAFLVVFVLVAGLLMVVRNRRVAAAVCGVAAVAFVQQVFLLRLAEHGAFDGTGIDWAPLGGLAIVEVLVAMVLFGALMAPGVRVRHVTIVALFLLFFQLAGVAVDLPALWRSADRQGTTQTERQDYLQRFGRLSKQRNIIHIVTDHTQGALTRDLLQGDLASDLGHLEAALDGFTMFTHASGRFPSTYPSISYYMTGRSPEPDADVVASFPLSNALVRDTLADHSVVNTLAAASFETYGAMPTSLYCAGDFVACLPIDILSGQPESGSRDDAVRQYLSLVDVSLFQGTPIVVREHVYRDGQWLLARGASGLRTPSGVFDELMRRMTVTDSAGSYNYLHHPGGHPPIQFDADCTFIGTQTWTRESTGAQVTCFLRQLTALVERLTRLGVYDQTTILVHGDHGSQWPTPLVAPVAGTGVPTAIIGMANPLVLLKPAGARGPLRYSSAPVSLADVPATLADSVGIATHGPGQPMLDVAEDAVRERTFLFYQPGATNIYRDGNLGPTQRYRIRGNLFDPRDWVAPAPLDGPPRGDE